MIKPIAIIAGEPNSISSEIIFKSWKLRKKYRHKPFFVIGSISLLKMQIKKLKLKIKIKKINENFSNSDFKGPALPVFNINYKAKKPFEKISTKSNQYIFKCFDFFLKLSKSKKIIGLINCPVVKETLFKKKHQGVTEYLAKKSKKENNEVMLIYNEKLAISPITTHIDLKEVSKKINKIKIIKKIKTINNFYKRVFNKSPNFAVLGLNPHNFYKSNKSREKKLINDAIKLLKKSNIKVHGPISPDSSFIFYKRNKFDVIIGMYHDQVLSPFKALFNYDAINITLGLPYVRISPDHGVAYDMVGKNKANPLSLIKAIKFFNFIK